MQDASDAGWLKAGWVSSAATIFAFAIVCLSMILTVSEIAIRLAADCVALVAGSRPAWGVVGVVDLTQFFIIAAAAFSIAVAFFRGAHVRIDLVTMLFPRGLRLVSSVFATLVSLILMAGCVWAGYGQLKDQFDFPASSATLGVPLTYYWLPFLAGLALAVVACAFNLLRWKEETTGSGSHV